MKKIFTLFLLSILAVSVFAQKSLAVATFDVAGNAVSKEEAVIITDLCITELNSTGFVRVLSRTEFENILQKNKFQNTDLYDSKKAVDIGKIADVELLAYGQIVKLGEKLSVSLTIIDSKTALILSSTRMNPNSLGDVLNQVAGFATSAVNGLMLKVGDIGPGGGTICFVEGNEGIEFSEVLGKADFEDAKTLCGNYLGGGYEDWHLPTKDELNYIYKCLKTQGCSEPKWYWSSTLASDDGYGWGQRFSDGFQGNPSLSNIHFVRAIRAFSY